MLSWALGFFIVAIIAAVFGFGGIAAGAAGIAKFLFFLFLLAFVPVVMGMGGNSGTQTSTITVRGLATGRLELTGGRIGHYLWQQMKVGVLLGLATGLVAGLRTEGGKQKRDKLLLKVAVIGGVVRYAILERFCRILAAMVKAGVPLPDAMNVATETTASRNWGKLVARRSSTKGVDR
jgi:uncharacterized membrane protein YtjA (UPF0391 family)